MYIQKAISCKRSVRQTKDYRKRNEKTKKKLITKERTKEQNERITRGESPNPRLVKKRTTKRSKQVVIRFFHVLKSLPISLPQS